MIKTLKRIAKRIRRLYWLITRDDSFVLAHDEDYIKILYHVVLGRAPDKGGESRYLQLYREGELTKMDLLVELTSSEEFQNNLVNKNIKYDYKNLLDGYVTVFSNEKFLPYVEDPPFESENYCGLADPRKWEDPEWFDLLKTFGVIPSDKRTMHRKGWEWVHPARALLELGVLNDQAKCLGVGAGHEALSFWFANRAGSVIATDLFDEESDWAKKAGKEGDSMVVADPAKYAPFPYREERLTFMRMDGRKLDFDDASFDVIYTISAIEHFGGPEETAKSMREMGRVLKPGGVAAVVTELVLNGKTREEFFTPDQLLEYVVAPSGLKLIQAPVFEVSKYALDRPLAMPKERNFTPHFVLEIKGVVYTSVGLIMRKPL